MVAETRRLQNTRRAGSSTTTSEIEAFANTAGESGATGAEYAHIPDHLGALEIDRRPIKKGKRLNIIPVLNINKFELLDPNTNTLRNTV